MKLKVALLALVLSLGLVACAKPWAGDPQLVHRLAINMPEAEVRKLMGEPSLVNRMEVMGVVTETWLYNGKQQVGLIVQDGKLVSAQLDGKTIMQAEAKDL